MLMVGWPPPSVEVISEHAKRDEDEYEALREGIGDLEQPLRYKKRAWSRCMKAVRVYGDQADVEPWWCAAPNGSWRQALIRRERDGGPRSAVGTPGVTGQFFVFDVCCELLLLVLLSLELLSTAWFAMVSEAWAPRAPDATG